MRKLLMLGSLAALLVPAASHAQFQLGARLGFSPAMGDAVKGEKMSDGVKSQIPIQLDAAYKVTKDIAVGGYFGYGFAQTDLGGLCDIDGVDCSASVLRFGVQGIYTFNQLKSPLVPWAGVGFGYEIGTAKVEVLGESLDFTYSGFEFLNLQLGGDYQVNEKFAVGPFVSLSIAQYSKYKIEDSTGMLSVDGDITEKGTHEWLGFGIRGKFDL